MQFETLQKDMIAAMKARDKVRKDAISTLVSAAKKAAIDEGCRDDIKEELVIPALQAERIFWQNIRQDMIFLQNMHHR